MLCLCTDLHARAALQCVQCVAAKVLTARLQKKLWCGGVMVRAVNTHSLPRHTPCLDTNLFRSSSCHTRCLVTTLPVLPHTLPHHSPVVHQLRDLSLAIELLNEAAEAGHHAAQFYLAGAFESGTGVEEDLTMALELLRRSAHNDYAPAMNHLAQLHLTGEVWDKVEEVQGLTQDVWLGLTTRAQ